MNSYQHYVAAFPSIRNVWLLARSQKTDYFTSNIRLEGFTYPYITDK